MKSIKKFFNRLFGKKVEPAKKVKSKTSKVKKIAFTGINQKVIEKYPSKVIAQIEYYNFQTGTLSPAGELRSRTIKFYDEGTKSTNIDTIVFQKI